MKDLNKIRESIKQQELDEKAKAKAASTPLLLGEDYYVRMYGDKETARRIMENARKAQLEEDKKDNSIQSVKQQLGESFYKLMYGDSETAKRVLNETKENHKEMLEESEGVILEYASTTLPKGYGIVIRGEGKDQYPIHFHFYKGKNIKHCDLDLEVTLPDFRLINENRPVKNSKVTWEQFSSEKDILDAWNAEDKNIYWAYSKAISSNPHNKHLPDLITKYVEKFGIDKNLKSIAKLDRAIKSIIQELYPDTDFSDIENQNSQLHNQKIV